MEFYHYMTLDIADGETFRIIGNVLRAFLHLHCDTVGYNKVIKLQIIYKGCIWFISFLTYVLESS